VAQEEESLR
jgi:hypothetical protein